MTITESDVYWITRCDIFADVTLHIALTFILLALVVWFWGLIFAACEDNTCIAHIATVIAVVSLLLSIVLFIGRVFIPTTKEIVAIKVIPVVANSKLVSKDAEVYIRRLLDIAIEKTEKKAGK